MARQVMTENLRRPWRRVGPGRPGAAFAGSRRSRRGLTGALLVAPAAILIAGLFVVPLVLDGWMSLNNWPLLGGHKFAGLANYRQLFDDRGVRHALVFTVIFTVVIVPLVFAGRAGAGQVPAALATGCGRLPGRRHRPGHDRLRHRKLPVAVPDRPRHRHLRPDPAGSFTWSATPSTG